MEAASFQQLVHVVACCFYTELLTVLITSFRLLYDKLLTSHCGFGITNDK